MSLFVMSEVTLLIRQHLSATTIEGVVSYHDLSAVAGAPITGTSNVLRSARHSLLKNERIVFHTIPGVGIMRLGDQGIVQTAASHVDGLRRHARRSVLKITAVTNYSGLTPADQLAHTTRLTVFTAVADLTSDRGVKRIEKAASGRSTELPISELLASFARK